MEVEPLLEASEKRNWRSESESDGREKEEMLKEDLEET